MSVLTGSQHALTVVAEIDPARRRALDATLAEMAADPEGNAILPMAALPRTHFARFVVLDGDPELPAQLAFESNHDGGFSEYVRLVAGAVGPGLDRVFGACVGWPRRGAADLAGVRSFFHERKVRAEAFHCGYRGLPVEQVQNDLTVRQLIADYLDAHDAELRALPPQEIQARIRRHLDARRREPAYRGLSTAPRGDEGGWGYTVGLVTGLVYHLPAALAGVALLALTWPFLRRRNRIDEVAPCERPVWSAPELVRVEDKHTQNQLTHVVELKPGLLRLALLRVVLLAVDVVSRYRDNRGELGGIPTIHFGRWVLLPDPRERARPPRRRLLFFSNYDGSWESYLGDFIDRASAGLTGIWTNTRGFPQTDGLFSAGSRDEEAFKQWTRDHQVATQVWFTAVPRATVQNVLDARWIRERVERRLSDEECRTWLARI